MSHAIAVRRRLAVGFLVLALTPACAKKPKEIRISPARTTIYGLKRTVVLAGMVIDTKGREMPGQEITWQVDKPAVATVDKNGVVTAVKPGKAQVKAAYQNASGTAHVEVVDAATITLSPIRMTIAGPPGSHGTLGVEVKSSKGTPVEARPKWSSSDVKVATVDANGVVTSVSAGRVTITATLGDLGNASDVTVTTRPVAQFDAAPKTLILKAGDTQKVTPTALDDSGKEIADPAVDWSSADPKVAKVVDGMVTGVAAGSTTIHAVAGAKSADVSVLVN